MKKNNHYSSLNHLLDTILSLKKKYSIKIFRIIIIFVLETGIKIEIFFQIAGNPNKYGISSGYRLVTIIFMLTFSKQKNKKYVLCIDYIVVKTEVSVTGARSRERYDKFYEAASRATSIWFSKIKRDSFFKN